MAHHIPCPHSPQSFIFSCIYFFVVHMPEGSPFRLHRVRCRCVLFFNIMFSYFLVVRTSSSFSSSRLGLSEPTSVLSLLCFRFWSVSCRVEHPANCSMCVYVLFYSI